MAKSSKKAKMYRITPRRGAHLNVGVLQEMERYDGKYEEVIRKGARKHGVLHEVYDELVITAKRLTADRWRSFGLFVEEVR